MDFGKMRSWVNGRIRFGDKNIMEKILLKPNIPVFHHSIIPWLMLELGHIPVFHHSIIPWLMLELGPY
jgi:hypothetical protein